MRSVTKFNRISPKKTGVVAALVRGQSVNAALEILKFTPKKAAKLLYKAVLSAAKNAEKNEKQEIDQLYIKTLLVTKGPTLKRAQPVSRGRSHPILKRTSQIRVELATK